MSTKTKEPPLSKTNGFQNFKSTLTEAKRILLSTHILPDGDGLGAETALFHYLKRARKACRVYNPDPLPRRYRFLDPKGTILLGPTEVEIWDTFDVWLIVDTNDPRRLGKLWNELSLRAKKIFFLDHHMLIPSNPASSVKNQTQQLDSAKLPDGASLQQLPPHATVLSDTTSSSIGELLYNLFDELKLTKINPDIGQGLYVSVMTDTNSFRYARTTPLAHRIAAEMIELGVNPEDIYQSIYSSKETSHIQLLGTALQNVRISQNGKIAWLEIDLALRQKFRASPDDTQSFLNLLLLLKEAEIVCLFREDDDNHVRVSIKSKGRIQVHRVAMELGGGGHEFASGASIFSPLNQAVNSVILKLENAIKESNTLDKN